MQKQLNTSPEGIEDDCCILPDILELWKINGTDSIRILHIAITGRTFLLLHGFKKKQNKTSPIQVLTSNKKSNDRW